MSDDEYQGTDGHYLDDDEGMASRFAGSYFDDEGKFVRLYWGERNV